MMASHATQKPECISYSFCLCQASLESRMSVISFWTACSLVQTAPCTWFLSVPLPKRAHRPQLGIPGTPNQVLSCKATWDLRLQNKQENNIPTIVLLITIFLTQHQLPPSWWLILPVKYHGEYNYFWRLFTSKLHNKLFCFPLYFHTIKICNLNSSDNCLIAVILRGLFYGSLTCHTSPSSYEWKIIRNIVLYRKKN